MRLWAFFYKFLRVSWYRILFSLDPDPQPIFSDPGYGSVSKIMISPHWSSGAHLWFPMTKKFLVIIGSDPHSYPVDADPVQKIIMQIGQDIDPQPWRKVVRSEIFSNFKKDADWSATMIHDCDQIFKMWWLIEDVVSHWRCAGSLVAHQTSGAEVPGSNPASPTMILMRCRIIVK